MSLNSLAFVLFVFISVTVYYLIPGRYQWFWLLTVSYFYYIVKKTRLLLQQEPDPKVCCNDTIPCTPCKDGNIAAPESQRVLLLCPERRCNGYQTTR